MKASASEILDEFEAAIRAHEMRGGVDPAEVPEIKREFEGARAAAYCLIRPVDHATAHNELMILCLRDNEICYSPEGQRRDEAGQRYRMQFERVLAMMTKGVEA